MSSRERTAFSIFSRDLPVALQAASLSNFASNSFQPNGRIGSPAKSEISCVNDSPLSSQAERIEKAYGLDWWGRIDAIRNTFVDRPGVKLSRSWVWEPKADRVTYEGKDKAGNPVKATYVRSQLSSLPENVQKEIDPAS
jgi:hypothetical protein